MQSFAIPKREISARGMAELVPRFVDANGVLLRLSGQHDGFAPEDKAKAGVVNLKIE